MEKTANQTSILKTKLLVGTVQKLSLARNIEEVMQIVKTVARELTGADGATFVLRDGDLCYYADEDAISPLWKGSRFPMETCISGWTMLNKKAAVIKDIYLDDRIPIDAYRPTFVKSLVMVPIRKIKPIGAIGNYWAKIHEPTPEEVELLQSLADITSVSIENIEIRNTLEDKLDERSKMLKTLEAQQKQMEEFTNVVAHNLRAPLSNLMLLNDMISESGDINDKLSFLEKQKPALDFLYQTFEELVDAIHVKTDFTKKRDHIDLEECWLKTMSLLQGEIIKTKAKIQWDFSKEKTAYFPKEYLDSILFNLLSNAIKFRHPERIPEISIKSYKKEGWSYIKIEDNGLGIDLKKYGDKVFGLHKTFHNHPNSKGFGLFITKTQIEAMDGEISLDSTPNKGSTFTIKLFKNK